MKRRPDPRPGSGDGMARFSEPQRHALRVVARAFARTLHEGESTLSAATLERVARGGLAALLTIGDRLYIATPLGNGFAIAEPWAIADQIVSVLTAAGFDLEDARTREDLLDTLTPLVMAELASGSFPEGGGG